MTTSTIIPYRAGKQYAPAEGPTNCTRCARFLLDRASDKTEDSWDGPTELTVHIWEHDVDSEGRALCGSCAEVDDQTEAWRQIVAWKWRSEKRSHILSNSGLELFDDYRSVAMFAAKDGKLDVGLVLAFVGRDPLRPVTDSRAQLGNPPGAPAWYSPPRPTLADLRAWHEAQHKLPDDECPETERNTER